MQPKSIIAFRWVVYLECTCSFAGTYLFWLTRRHIVDPTHAPPRFVFYVMGAILAFILFLAWLIARRASKPARWIYVICSGLSFLSLLNMRAILAVGTDYAAVSFAQLALTAVSIWLLFRRDSRDWFAGRRPVDPAVFD